MFRTKQSRTEAAVDQARSTATDLGSAASDRLGSLRESAADSAGDAAAIAKDRAYAAKAAAAPAIQDGTSNAVPAASPPLRKVLLVINKSLPPGR